MDVIGCGYSIRRHPVPAAVGFVASRQSERERVVAVVRAPRLEWGVVEALRQSSQGTERTTVERYTSEQGRFIRSTTPCPTHESIQAGPV
jgi:hypothetical protein